MLAIVFYVISNLDSSCNPLHAPRHRASEAHFDFPLGSIYPSTCRAHFDVDLATSAKFFQAIYFASISLSLLLCEWLAVAAATPDPLTLSASMPTIAQLRRQEGEGRKEGIEYSCLFGIWAWEGGSAAGRLAGPSAISDGGGIPPPLSLKFRGRPRLTSRAMSSFLILERVSERGRCSS